MLFEQLDFHQIYRELQRQAGAGIEESFLVCIDEIQNFPEVTKTIKFLIDHYGVKFIVTGSSNFYLRNLFPESLSGRKFLFTLNPLSYREYLYFHSILPEDSLQPDFKEVTSEHSPYTTQKRRALYDQYMEFGGFPEVALTQDDATKRLILRNIFASFFEKDVKVFSELKDIRELRDLILLLAARNGNILDITRLSSELGINRVKSYAYLEFLEACFFLRLIPKHSQSIDRSVAGGRKVYFSDTGILNLICKTTSGQLLETTVANQLQAYGSIAFYNKRNTAEIDFILNGEIALEVKQKAIEPDIRRLSKLSQNLSISEYYVISNSPEIRERVIFPWFL